MKSLGTWIKILVMTNILGAATHLYLTIQHYQLKLGLSSGPAICNINATFNCDSVAASKYASVFGIPVALFGLMGQLISLIFILTILFGLSENSDRLKKVYLYFSALIALTSLAMGSISTFLLGTYCLFCMGAYLLSFVQIFAAIKIQSSGELIESQLEFPRWSVILVLFSPLLAWMINSMTLSQNGYQLISQYINDSIAEWQQNPPQNFSMENGLILGADPKTSKLIIVEFADFLCPHCKYAYPIIDAFVQSHKEASLVYKFFPLEGNCNPGITHKGDGVRCKLAGIAYCAEKLGKKGWEAHHYIFEHQESFGGIGDFESVYNEIAANLAMNKEELKACAQSDTTNDAIATMAKEGLNAKIQGTPSVFVNGKELPRAQQLPVLNAVFNEIFKQ